MICRVTAQVLGTCPILWYERSRTEPGLQNVVVKCVQWQYCTVTHLFLLACNVTLTISKGLTRMASVTPAPSPANENVCKYGGNGIRAARLKHQCSNTPYQGCRFVGTEHEESFVLLEGQKFDRTFRCFDEHRWQDTFVQ